MERRQRNAVDASIEDGRYVRLMRRIDELKAQIENSTERFFALAEKVEDERATMRSFEKLTRLTESVLAAQMKHIRCVREEMA